MEVGVEVCDGGRWWRYVMEVGDGVADGVADGEGDGGR